MPHDTELVRFVRALLGGGAARRLGDAFVLGDGRRAAAARILDMIHAGALEGNDQACRANGLTAGWLKRARLDAAAFAAQHRIEVNQPDGPAINLAESPLTRLAAGPDAFLERHHVEAGERVRRLVEKAQIQPRVTMAYSPSRFGKQSSQGAPEISDLAADARRAIADIHRVLPRDCAGVVLDVCGLLKGLQHVESERGWPRRSAKLVLRIGLDQLAQHYGMGPCAVGVRSGRPSKWMAEASRPERFE